MARTPFKMRSGNSTPFKQMGSSPLKTTSGYFIGGSGNETQISKQQYYINKEEAKGKGDMNPGYAEGYAAIEEKNREMNERVEVMRADGKDETYISDWVSTRKDHDYWDNQESKDYHDPKVWANQKILDAEYESKKTEQ